MKIGAQLYSVRDRCKNITEIKDSMYQLREIGYESIQLSGFEYDPYEVKRYADTIGMHIGLTHTPVSEIINDTESVINKHLILGADVVGLGNPGGYTFLGHIRCRKLLKDLLKPIQKINAAGLKFGYHNHYGEFQGRHCFMDYLCEKTNWNFILDVGWMHYSGVDSIKKIQEFAPRLEYIHLKDFRIPKNKEERIVDCCVPLYQGYTPLDDIIRELTKAGTQIAYVEQDTAPNSGDSIEQMRISFNNLKAHGWC